MNIALLLLISYDLSTRDRPAAYEAIKATIEAASGGRCMRPLYSQWLVKTEETIDTWVGRLQSHLSAADRLLILRVQGRTNGWLPNETWTWINARST